MKTTRYSSPFFPLKATHVLKRTCTQFNQKSVAPYELPNEKPEEKPVVKPVCNDGPVYIGHPVYYGYWTTLRKYCHMCSVKLICIKRSSLYNRCGHPLDSQNAQFHYIYLFITVNKLANFNMCAPQQTEKWMLAKSSNQPFHGNRMGELQTLNELHIQLNVKETCIYINIAVTQFSRVTVINRFDCTQHFSCNMVKERIILCN